MEFLNYNFQEFIDKTIGNKEYESKLIKKSNETINKIIKLFWDELTENQDRFLIKLHNRYLNLIPPYPMIEKFYFFLNTNQDEIDELDIKSRKYKNIIRNIEIIKIKKQEITLSNPNIYRTDMLLRNNVNEISNKSKYIVIESKSENEFTKQIKEFSKPKNK